ncbi:MAG: tRNA (N6-threonylcarbamoyladenosine(37)-N6)-methyltransferase TrmO [Ignavibacteriales bacterium]|nr:tRNA (N6-threonylcarbamoyladenosine(37)-N6)-methyltransferase TrmO [Ignavibacteriales bacterium]
MKEIRFKPIGIIHSPFKNMEGIPIQPRAGKGLKGNVEIFSEYTDGLKSLQGFSHIYLIFHLHLSKGYSLVIRPFMDDELHGVFATRAPKRPNQIGLSIVRLSRIEKNVLHIEDIDIVDGTPLLDIKPYVPEFDPAVVEKIGWLSRNINRLNHTKSDERFK